MQRRLTSLDLHLSETADLGELEQIIVGYESGPQKVKRRGGDWKSNARTDVLVAALALLSLRARASAEQASLDSRNGEREADLCAKLHDLWHSPRKRVESHWLDSVFDEGTEDLPSPLARVLSRSGGRRSATLRLAEGLDPAAVAFHLDGKLCSPPRLWRFLADRFGIQAPDSDSDPRLPTYRTSLVGRDGDMAKVAQLVRENRLVTLLGPSGVGKTRLAIEVARRAAGFAHPSRLVDLSSARTTEQATQLVLELFPGGGQGTKVSLGLLAEQFRELEMLLVLDNCETALVGASEVAEAILGASPGMTILATTLEPLRVHAEVCYRVLPLEVPEPRVPSGEALAFPSVRLFLDRARAAEATYEADQTRLASVLDVCRVVDGLPLGIELAASGIRHFPTQDLATLLVDPSDVIRSTDRSMPQRHESLRTIFEWTYGLLSEEEATILVALSCFPAEWYPATGISVCQALGIGSRAAFDAYRRLVDLSMVRTLSNGREIVPDPVRTFARQKRDSLPNGDRFSISFESYFLSEIEALSGRGSEDPIALFSPEATNYRAAASSALDHGRVGSAIRFVEALYPYWLASGTWGDGAELCRQVLQTSGLEPEDELRVLHAAAGLEFRLGRIAEARRHYERSRDLATRTDDVRARAHALHGLGTIAFRTDHLDEAEEYFVSAVSMWAEEGIEKNVLSAANNLAAIAATRGRYEQASERFASVVELATRSGDKRTLASALTNFGLMRWRMEDGNGAKTYFLRSLEVLEGLGDPWGEANVCNNLGVLSLSSGDLPLSATYHGRSLRIREQLGEMAGIAASLEGFASLALADGNPHRALRLIAAARSLRSQHELELTVENRRGVGLTTENARARMTAAEADREEQLGKSLSWKEAVALALTVTPRG